MGVLLGLTVVVSFFLGAGIGCFFEGCQPILAGAAAVCGMGYAWLFTFFAVGAYRCIKQPRRLRYHFPQSMGKMKDSELENGPPPSEDERISVRRSIGVALLWLGFRVGG